MLIAAHLRNAAQREALVAADRLIDSLPVMLRANRARVARQMADVGFCATKQIHYCAVKLHVLAARWLSQLLLPERLSLSQASQHDLAALREFDPQLTGCALFSDKAYADTEMKTALQEHRLYLVTPYNRKRSEAETAVPTLFNRLVSSIRQPLTTGQKLDNLPPDNTAVCS